MKIALIGYGKMGKEIEQIAIARGHEIVSIIDIDNQENFESEAFRSADVAIEFTIPAKAVDNYRKCFAANVPVVSGTTGWIDSMDEVRSICEKEGKTLFWTSNFSIGMNIFFAVNRYLSKIMNAFPEYNVSIEEVHHTQKLDAPSGTAITLADDIIKNLDRKTQWVKEREQSSTDLVIASVRRGTVPGIHEITYDSEADTILIKHDAKSRKGLALGAVLAAEFTHGKKGFLSMNDLFSF